MRTLIITSSYPSKEHPSDGSFVQAFENALPGVVVILAPARNEIRGINVFDLPWLGGNQALASLNMLNPINWFIALHFLVMGCWTTVRLCKRLKIDRILCFWLIPSGIFGLAARLFAGVQYDGYMLGSDVWKFKRSRLGLALLKLLSRAARRNYADGKIFAEDIAKLLGVPCSFLPLARDLPVSTETRVEEKYLKKFLFVGRYHENKGPDLLIKAVAGMFKSQRAMIRVYMHGFGPMGAELHEELAKAGLEEVITIGEEICAQSLSNWLGYVDYLVIPSRIDSIPVIAIDSIRADCPIIAMPVGDLPWLIEKFNCGVLAKEATASALCQAMLKTVFSVDRASFLPGCQEAARLFDIQRSAKRWADDT